MNRTTAAGNRGESETAKFLRKKGYVLLASQWRCRFGELDLVAQTPKGVVCFVEVKLRAENSIALPREAVDVHKQNRLRKSAAAYMSRYEIDAPARFDVAEVYEKADGSFRLEYLENAFE